MRRQRHDLVEDLALYLQVRMESTMWRDVSETTIVGGWLAGWLTWLGIDEQPGMALLQ